MSGGSLKERLIARIRKSGAITFAAYMEAALYDPQGGYYMTHPRIGFEGGDYFTSADLGPAFGRALAKAVVELWTALDRPHSWDLVEAGAGHGTVLRDLLTALERDRSDAARGVRPAIIEVSPTLRRQQALTLEGRDLRWAAAPGALAPIQGVVFANEVLDAFPVHVLERTEQGVREVFVDEKAGELIETLKTPSQPDLRWRVPETVPMGSRWEVSPAAEGWVAGLAAAVGTGYLVLVDYGDEEAGLLSRAGAGTLRGFASHRIVSDPFAAPGATDLTASVNFTAIRRAAEGAGLVLAGSGTQRDVLVALGVREATGRPTNALDQLRAASQRSAVDVLLDPNGLGAFRVLCFAKDAPAESLKMFEAKRS